MSNLSENDHPTQLLLLCAEHGDLSGLARLLSKGADPRHNDSGALVRASYHGHAECVKLLIPASDPKANHSLALYWAAVNGHAECVTLLIPVSDPKASDSKALRHAAMEGRAECVKILIPFSDAKARESSALLNAARHGHSECVKILAPISDIETIPDANGESFHALLWAAGNGHAECVRLLIPISAPKHRAQALQDAIDYGNVECAKLLIASSGSLLKNKKALELALLSGEANILSAMLAHEPSLLDQFDLAAALDAAVAENHFDLQSLLRSLIEQQDLDTHLSPSNAAVHKPSRL